MAVNLFVRFQKLIPRSRLYVGTVTAFNINGTSTVVLDSGGTIIAQGQTVPIGNKAFVQDERIEGEAPSLTTFFVDV